MTPKQVVIAFVDAVNSKDLRGMSGLMATNHLFVDPLGKRVPGRSLMETAWSGLFDIVPDYHIAVRHAFAEASSVVVVGTASGTYCGGGKARPQNHWEVPAAWSAEVRDGKISEWHAFVDNEPLRRIMMHCGGPTKEA